MTDIVEIKRHKWIINGERYRADFFPFVDGVPRHDIDCEQCAHSDSETGVCDLAPLSDEKVYLFCGPICGHFKPREGEEKWI